ncbi:MAG: hypothetical protein JWM28_1831, partial [Chitinophagaceae bacterium]|nr:hypothetical protein [Chitinophagaceae bacterium]
MPKLLSILIILLCWDLGFSQCQVSITPNKASYCAGEAVTIRVLNVQGLSTYKIQVGSQTVNDTIGVFFMPGGGGVTKDY